MAQNQIERHRIYIHTGKNYFNVFFFGYVNIDEWLFLKFMRLFPPNIVVEAINNDLA